MHEKKTSRPQRKKKKKKKVSSSAAARGGGERKGKRGTVGFQGDQATWENKNPFGIGKRKVLKGESRSGKEMIKKEVLLDQKPENKKRGKAKGETGFSVRKGRRAENRSHRRKRRDQGKAWSLLGEKKRGGRTSSPFAGGSLREFEGVGKEKRKKEKTDP